MSDKQYEFYLAGYSLGLGGDIDIDDSDEGDMVAFVLGQIRAQILKDGGTGAIATKAFLLEEVCKLQNEPLPGPPEPLCIDTEAFKTACRTVANTDNRALKDPANE